MLTLLPQAIMAGRNRPRHSLTGDAGAPGPPLRPTYIVVTSDDLSHLNFVEYE